MKLQHRLGGLENVGPVNTEHNVFVESWEKRIFGIHMAMMGLSNHLPNRADNLVFDSEWTWADLRKGAEGMNPFEYFKYRYYEKWLGGISGFFIDEGYITSEELEERAQQYLKGTAGQATGPAGQEVDDQIRHYMQFGDSPKAEIDMEPRFSKGQMVRIRDKHVVDHTRLPGYLRNKVGQVVHVYEGAWTYFQYTGPDGIGDPMPVYSVMFEQDDVWGELGEPKTWLYADLFETYLAPAD
ncbi:MAG: nitrile hydratase subunit beta [Spiribacter salinus]|uniref:nitrile hydratase n=1 Tax=Spiribacter salinus TaxID=1335746 RepID=A0A540VRU9_9GAMM|nr:MAG: nitrile hydratase subunit beta [Spiribacter salinus]